MIVAVDTDVIVAAHAWWDGRQDAAAAAINRFADEKTLIVPYHALMQSYSVLTRLPRPYRVLPAEAFRALRITFAHVAREAGAEAILTFNARHFWGEGLQVLSP
jgi:predicted nucleic acid-binding protein